MAAAAAKAAVAAAAKSVAAKVAVAKAAATGAGTTVKAAATAAGTTVKAAATTAAATVRRKISSHPPLEVPTKLKELKATRMNSEGYYRPFDPNVAALILDEKINLMDSMAIKYHRGYGWECLSIFSITVGLISYDNRKFRDALKQEVAEDS